MVKNVKGFGIVERQRRVDRDCPIDLIKRLLTLITPFKISSSSEHSQGHSFGGQVLDGLC